MRVSVIIPTYNRANVLDKVLQGYAEQSGDHSICEILVVDDGSRDHTASIADKWTRNLSITVKYLRKTNGGPASARNHAIRQAAGDLLLLGDDDVIPSGEMVANHVRWHKAHPEANSGALGLVTWAAELNPTPFMMWSGLYGPQFNYGCFTNGMEIDFRFAYGCNMSLKTSFVREAGLFDESIRSAGWEDLEFAYRLSLKGFRLFYDADAVGYHYKFETFDDARRRVEKLYSSWPAFEKTEAGRRFLELRNTNKRESERMMRRALLPILKPAKSAIIRLLRPLVDTRMALPSWLYDMIFYYYVPPFSNFVARSSKADYS